MASESGQERCETRADIVAELRARARRFIGYHGVGWSEGGRLMSLADRIESAAKREIDEIVSAVSELKDGMCIHCDLQQQCAEGEDGMPTTCNAMAKVRNFLQRYEKQEVNDGLPF